MNKSKMYPIIMALLSALLFGASAPLIKMILGEIDPVPLAAFLYLGSGFGLIIFKLIISKIKKEVVNEASLKKTDLPWLVGAIIFGGVLAPIVLMISLKNTPASTASLLLNFECVATTIIALVFFKENIGKQILGAVGLITLASIILSWNSSNQWGFSIASLGIIFACFCWGIDNNFTRNISAKDPFSIVIIKGIAAGLFSLFLSIIMGSSIPNFRIVVIVMLIGFLCYGVSIVLFVFAMRAMGSARTSALFGAAPFIGAILSFVLLGDIPNTMVIIAFPIMITGTILLLKENHNHVHRHEPVVHEHRHNHCDNHHNHEHKEIVGFDPKLEHTHIHAHELQEHSHPHSPDIAHRHSH